MALEAADRSSASLEAIALNTLRGWESNDPPSFKYASGGGVHEPLGGAGAGIHQTLEPQPPMTNAEHRKWILGLVEELDDGGSSQGSAGSSGTVGKASPPLAELERQVITHFGLHPELGRQYTHADREAHCLICFRKAFRTVGDVYMHAAETRKQRQAHRVVAAVIRWLHGGREPPRR